MLRQIGSAVCICLVTPQPRGPAYEAVPLLLVPNGRAFQVPGHYNKLEDGMFLPELEINLNSDALRALVPLTRRPEVFLPLFFGSTKIYRAAPYLKNVRVYADVGDDFRA